MSPADVQILADNGFSFSSSLTSAGDLTTPAPGAALDPSVNIARITLTATMQVNPNITENIRSGSLSQANNSTCMGSRPWDYTGSTCGTRQPTGGLTQYAVPSGVPTELVNIAVDVSECMSAAIGILTSHQTKAIEKGVNEVLSAQGDNDLPTFSCPNWRTVIHKLVLDDCLNVNLGFRTDNNCHLDETSRRNLLVKNAVNQNLSISGLKSQKKSNNLKNFLRKLTANPTTVSLSMEYSYEVMQTVDPNGNLNPDVQKAQAEAIAKYLSDNPTAVASTIEAGVLDSFGFDASVTTTAVGEAVIVPGSVGMSEPIVNTDALITGGNAWSYGNWDVGCGATETCTTSETSGAVIALIQKINASAVIDSDVKYYRGLQNRTATCPTTPCSMAEQLPLQQECYTTSCIANSLTSTSDDQSDISTAGDTGLSIMFFILAGVIGLIIILYCRKNYVRPTQGQEMVRDVASGRVEWHEEIDEISGKTRIIWKVAGDEIEFMKKKDAEGNPVKESAAENEVDFGSTDNLRESGDGSKVQTVDGNGNVATSTKKKQGVFAAARVFMQMKMIGKKQVKQESSSPSSIPKYPNTTSSDSATTAGARSPESISKLPHHHHHHGHHHQQPKEKLLFPACYYNHEKIEYFSLHYKKFISASIEKIDPVSETFTIRHSGEVMHHFLSLEHLRLPLRPGELAQIAVFEEVVIDDKAGKTVSVNVVRGEEATKDMLHNQHIHEVYRSELEAGHLDNDYGGGQGVNKQKTVTKNVTTTSNAENSVLHHHENIAPSTTVKVRLTWIGPVVVRNHFWKRNSLFYHVETPDPHLNLSHQNTGPRSSSTVGPPPPHLATVKAEEIRRYFKVGDEVLVKTSLENYHGDCEHERESMILNHGKWTKCEITRGPDYSVPIELDSEECHNYLDLVTAVSSHGHGGSKRIPKLHHHFHHTVEHNVHSGAGGQLGNTPRSIHHHTPRFNNNHSNMHTPTGPSPKASPRPDVKTLSEVVTVTVPKDHRPGFHKHTDFKVEKLLSTPGDGTSWAPTSPRGSGQPVTPRLAPKTKSHHRQFLNENIEKTLAKLDNNNTNKSTTNTNLPLPSIHQLKGITFLNMDRTKRLVQCKKVNYVLKDEELLEALPTKGLLGPTKGLWFRRKRPMARTDVMKEMGYNVEDWSEEEDENHKKHHHHHHSSHINHSNDSSQKNIVGIGSDSTPGLDSEEFQFDPGRGMMILPFRMAIETEHGRTKTDLVEGPKAPRRSLMEDSFLRRMATRSMETDPDDHEKHLKSLLSEKKTTFAHGVAGAVVFKKHWGEEEDKRFKETNSSSSSSSESSCINMDIESITSRSRAELHHNHDPVKLNHDHDRVSDIPSETQEESGGEESLMGNKKNGTSAGPTSSLSKTSEELSEVRLDFY